jgi:hypothetical protein
MESKYRVAQKHRRQRRDECQRSAPEIGAAEERHRADRREVRRMRHQSQRGGE